MGCHTWAYTSLKEEDMPYFMEKLLKEITSWPCIPLEGESREDYLVRRKQELNEYLSFEKQEDRDIDVAEILAEDEHNYESYKEFTNFIKSNPSLQEICAKIDVFGTYYGWAGYRAINGQLYKECGFDVPVRIYGYPEETFTDAEKFIKWIEENNIKPERSCKEISLKEAAKLIREFWAKYNNEVYVEFG